MRRVIVKARYVKLKGSQSRTEHAHLRYLQRDGVSREGEPGGMAVASAFSSRRAATFSTAASTTHTSFESSSHPRMAWHWAI